MGVDMYKALKDVADSKDIKYSFDSLLYGEYKFTKVSLRKEIKLVVDSYKRPLCYGVRYADKDMPGGYSTYGRRFYIQGEAFDVTKKLADEYENTNFDKVPTYNRNKYIPITLGRWGALSPLDSIILCVEDGCDYENVCITAKKIETVEQLSYILSCFRGNRKVDLKELKGLSFKFVE